MPSKPIATFQAHSSRVNGLAFTHDGSRLAAASNDSTITLWDASARGTPRSRTPLLRVHSFGDRGPVPLTGVAIGPPSAGGLVVLAHHAHNVPVLNLTLDRRMELEGHEGWIPNVAFSSDGSLIGSASLDGTARIWDSGTGKSLAVLEGHELKSDGQLPAGVWSIAFSPDSRIAATAGSDGTIRLWDARSGRALRVIEADQGLVFTVACGPDGKLLASGGSDGSIKIWDSETGALKRTLIGHRNWVVCVTFSGRSGWLASASWDKTARLWKTRGEAPVASVRTNGPCHGVAFNASGKTMATAEDNGTARLWDVGGLAGLR